MTIEPGNEFVIPVTPALCTDNADVFSYRIETSGTLSHSTREQT